jgi:Holliday junction resolvase RusA-like endonuclease
MEFEQRVADEAREVVNSLGGMPYPTERIRLTVIWHRLYHDGRRRDLDNTMKAIKDGITNGGLWSDDSQVSEIIQQMRYDAEENEWIEMWIQPDPLQPFPRKKRRSKKRASS